MGAGIAPPATLADDGKRLKAVDVVLALFLGENSLEWEGVPGGGGLKIGPGG